MRQYSRRRIVVIGRLLFIRLFNLSGFIEELRRNSRELRIGFDRRFVILVCMFDFL